MRNTSTHEYVDIPIYEQWIVDHKYGKYENVNSTFDGRNSNPGQSQKLHCSMKESGRLQITEQQKQWDIQQVPIQRNI